MRAKRTFETNQHFPVNRMNLRSKRRVRWFVNVSLHNPELLGIACNWFWSLRLCASNSLIKEKQQFLCANMKWDALVNHAIFDVWTQRWRSKTFANRAVVQLLVEQTNRSVSFELDSNKLVDKLGWSARMLIRLVERHFECRADSVEYVRFDLECEWSCSSTCVPFQLTVVHSPIEIYCFTQKIERTVSTRSLVRQSIEQNGLHERFDAIVQCLGNGLVQRICWLFRFDRQIRRTLTLSSINDNQKQTRLTSNVSHQSNFDSSKMNL